MGGLVGGLVVLTLAGAVALSVGASVKRGGACSGATPALWKPWSTKLRGDVTGEGQTSTVFVGQRYPVREPCARILFIVTHGRTIMYPLGGGTNGFQWVGAGSPAPIALAAIDRTPGAEIVLRIATFRVTYDAAVFTVREGRIVKYKLPPKWVEGDAFNYGWSDAGSSYAPGVRTVDCIRRHSGLVVWSDAVVTPWLNVTRGPKGYDLLRTFMRISGLHFAVVGRRHEHVKALPFEFAAMRNEAQSPGIFGSCLDAHNWSADIPLNPKEPVPG